MRNFAPQMEKDMQSYRLSDLVKIKNGKGHKMLSNGKYPVLGSGGIMRYVDKFLYDKPSVLLPRKGTLDNIQYCDMPFWTVDTLYYTEVNTNLANPYYLYRYLSLLDLSNLDSGTGVPSMTFDNYYGLKIFLPNIEKQTKIAQILQTLDKKITINRQINQNLEAMAKLLYDYWFVQFDFPNENGKPYKSSGGKMVWNKKIKREIPEGWKEVTLNAFIDKNKAGDWGYDIPKDGTIKVGCVRGADIIKLNDVPTRYITSKHSDRLLEDGDIVIEISGGSPVQATGRVALITNGVIGRNGGALVCSNFCQSFNMKKREFSEYFYYLWQNLYDNGNMFNFEGKTSGIKNFQTDVFLANHWFEVPKQLIETFHTIVAQYHLMIDQNIIENNNLTKQRDELLPLLMNGQVSVNSDLSLD